RNARILLTSGSKINMNLLVSVVDDLLDQKNNSYSIHELLNQHIKIYTINDGSCEVGVNLSDGEFEDPKSVRLLNWNCTEKVAIEKISAMIKNISEQPINKIAEFYIKILIEDKELYLGVNEEGNLAPTNKPILLWISNVPFLDQIAYQISICDFNFIVRFEWETKDDYDKFYLVDLNTEDDLYFALDYHDYDDYDDYCMVDAMGEFEESTPLPHFKKQPTKEGALLFNFAKNPKENSTNQSAEKRKSGTTLYSFLMELGEYSVHLNFTIINALNYIIRACNAKKVFKSLSDECLQHLRVKLDSEVEWEVTKNNLFNIKNAIIRLDESELPKLRSCSSTYKYATAMQVNIKNPQLDNLQIEIRISLNNNGSKSTLVYIPEITDISQTKSVYDYLLNVNVPQKKWKDLTMSYISLLIMPQLMVLPEFLKIPLPFLSDTSLLNQKINKEISDINFKIGPTGVRLIQTDLFLDTSVTEDMFQLDVVQISQLADIKITIINSDAVNGDPNIVITARANIKDNSVQILTQNENEQFLT
ncbi:9725_t:CDS:1, partial [Dentiscutata heterogama]